MADATTPFQFPALVRTPPAKQDRRLGAVLAEIASLANISADLLAEFDPSRTAACERLVLLIGALADAGAKMMVEGPPVERGDLADWMAPWLKDDGAASAK